MINTEGPTNGGWFRLSNSLVDDAWNHSRLAFQVYAVLARFADNRTGKCHPSYSTIADRCGCSERSVKREMKILAAAGLVDIRRRRDGSIRRTARCRQPHSPTGFP